jgi:hypothetical protein
MRSMTAGAVRSTVGLILTDDVITEFRTHSGDTLFKRSDVSTTLMLNLTATMLHDVAGNLTYPVFQRKVAPSPKRDGRFSKIRDMANYTLHKP